MQPLNTSIETGTRWLRAVAQGSTLLSAIMIGLVWAGASFHMGVERSDAEQAAVQNSANLARAFEEHLSRSLNQIDRSLKIMRSHYIQQPDGGCDFKDWLLSSEFVDDQTVQVGIIGPDGFLLVSNNKTGSAAKIDLSDRDHFRAHLNSKNDELFISKPLIGRASGKWSI